MRRLKVLLMKPYSEPDELIPPFGLGYLATAIRNDHDVEILDGIKEKLTLDKFGQILKEKRFDVVGIQIFTFHLSTIGAYMKTIREALPYAKIILGGPHPSCSSSDIFEISPGPDWAFRGEAEIGLARLLKLIAEENLQSGSLAEVPGLIWKRNGRTVINRQAFIENLDSLGIPSWDLMRPDTYPAAPQGAFFKNYPIAPILITRGCPFSCTYCAGSLVSGKKIRTRSVEKAIEEIKLLYNEYGVREIHVQDDNFTFNHNLVSDFCRKLKETGLDIAWTCPNGVRLDSLTAEILQTMKDAGLYSISVGVESGSDRVLKDMKKNLTTAQIKEKIDLIRKCGLEVSGFFIIGYPTETEKDIEETIRFAKELDLKRAGFSLFKPFPGTEITEDLLRRGEIKNTTATEWGKFVLADAAYAPRGFTLAEMKKFRQNALIAFYFRPKIIFKFLMEIKNFSHLKLVLKRVYSWLFKAK